MALKEKTLTEKELQDLKSLEQQYNSLVFQAGQLSLAEMEIKEEKLLIESNFKSLKTQETTLQQELFKKYGSGQINLEKGTITIE